MPPALLASTSGTTTSYSYDQSGQRVTQSVKKGGGATTTTTYFNRYFEKTGATTTLYVYLPSGELLATIEGNGAATSTYIVHTDNIDSSSVMTDKNGALAQQSAYYPFGAKRVSVVPASGFQEKRGFIGQYYDDAVALSYLNARYYDNSRGQFVSEDPAVRRLGLDAKALEQLLLDPQQQNYYSYARNNPVNLSDPSGELTSQQTAATLSVTVAILSSVVSGQISISQGYSLLGMVMNALSSSGGGGGGGGGGTSAPQTNRPTTPTPSGTGGGGTYISSPSQNNISYPQWTQRQIDRQIDIALNFGPGGFTKAGAKGMQFGKEMLENAVERFLRNEEKNPHTFSNPTHNLDPLVKELGGKEQVTRAVFEAANGSIPRGPAFGEGIEVTVANSTLKVTGNVEDDMLHIGNFWVINP